MFYNSILKKQQQQLSSFTWGKNGHVLITYSLGAAYIMAYLHYYKYPEC